MKEELTSEEKYKLHIVNLERKLAVVECEKAIANQDLANLKYKFLLSNIYNKYNLSENDSINDSGIIQREQLPLNLEGDK